MWRGFNAWSCAINRATCVGLGNSPLLGPSGLPPPALLDTDSRSHIGRGTKRGVLGPTVWTGRSRGHQGQTRGVTTWLGEPEHLQDGLDCGH